MAGASLAALASLAKAAGAEPPEGRAAIPDVVVYCDSTLVPAMRDLGRLFTARTRAPVFVFTAPPTLMLAQIDRETQNDVLVTTDAAMQEGIRQKLIRGETRAGAWRNSLAIAGRADQTKSPVAADAAAIKALLDSGRFAASDPTGPFTLDGPAVLDRLGLSPLLEGRMLGAPDTTQAAFLVTSGAARLGLLHLTDIRADGRLAVAATVPERAYAPIVYTAAVSVVALSPNSQAFVTFLSDPEAAKCWQADGLEVVS